MGSCAAPSAKGDDKFITTDYLQQCRIYYIETLDGYRFIVTAFEKGLMNGLREFIAANEEYFKYYRWS
ncbi:hypothetical protein CHE19_25180 (plasmid) [Salmonella enterica]|nr:hypothetical protein CHE19_25180 [Salmonella enterica]